jgi:protein TonB
MMMTLRPVGKVRTGKAPSRRRGKEGAGKRNQPAEPSVPLVTCLQQRQRLIGIIISILVHLGLLTYSAAWFMQRAQVHVDRGETSTTITLTISAPPQPTPSPPAPASVPQPLKPIAPVVTPLPIPPETIKATAPVAIAHPPAIAHPQPPLTRADAKPRTASFTHATSAARGATQAQPDDLHNEPPEYPEESQRAREQGVVILRVQVTAAGDPAEVSVRQSSGFFRLDQAARQAVRHWRFHPALNASGLPVSSEADVPVRFKLEGSPSN